MDINQNVRKETPVYYLNVKVGLIEWGFEK